MRFLIAVLALVLVLAPAVLAYDESASRVLDEANSPIVNIVDVNELAADDVTAPLALIQEEISSRGLTKEEDDLRVALLELDNENEAEAEAEAEADNENEAEADNENEAEAEGQTEYPDENMLLESFARLSGAQGEAPAESANPTYALPYPPLQPHYYSPLFNPYTNVNPLSYPFANYAAQPGTHPGLAAAAGVHASAFSARNAAIAHAGAFPYYPFAGGVPAASVAAGLYAPWIHPQNMNSAKVGENEAAEFPQFFESDSCINCSFN